MVRVIAHSHLKIATPIQFNLLDLEGETQMSPTSIWAQTRQGSLLHVVDRVYCARAPPRSPPTRVPGLAVSKTPLKGIRPGVDVTFGPAIRFHANSKLVATTESHHGYLS
jgi:hypothetical protein